MGFGQAFCVAVVFCVPVGGCVGRVGSVSAVGNGVGFLVCCVCGSFASVCSLFRLLDNVCYPQLGGQLHKFLAGFDLCFDAYSEYGSQVARVYPFLALSSQARLGGSCCRISVVCENENECFAQCSVSAW